MNGRAFEQPSPHSFQTQSKRKGPRLPVSQMTQGVILGCQGNRGNHLVITEATAVIITVLPKSQRTNTCRHTQKCRNKTGTRSSCIDVQWLTSSDASLTLRYIKLLFLRQGTHRNSIRLVAAGWQQTLLKHYTVIWSFKHILVLLR